jgi:hypothetical protein
LFQIIGFQTHCDNDILCALVFIAALIKKLTMQPELLHDQTRLEKALRFAICAGIIAQWTIGAIRGYPTESAAQNLTEQVYQPTMV